MNKFRFLELADFGKKRNNLYFIFGVLSIILFAFIVIAAPGWNGATGQTYLVSEDSFFTWNFSSNVTTPEYPMTFTFNSLSYSTNSTYSASSLPFWLTLNASTGIMTINVTNSSDAGFLNLTMAVVNSSGSGSVGPFYFLINATNDAPRFSNLENKSFNITELFSYRINISDEERDIPFTINVSFVECAVASWSTRNCSNSTGRELFTSSQYMINNTAAWINISFTPSRNDVGNYIINFSVRDLNNTVMPFNATRSHLVNFTVLNQNVPPYFTYVCDNERNASEDSLFNCLINFSDIDETNNITVTANYSFFKFNVTGTNRTVIPVNITTQFNGAAVVNFTPTDADVGNWTILVNLSDNSDIPLKSNFTTFNFYVSNVNDSVSITTTYIVDNGLTNTTITPGQNITVFNSNNYTIYLNATDSDLLIPDKSVYNDSLTFTSNNSALNITRVNYFSGTNIGRAAIFLNPNDLGPTGNYSVNITVRDLNNYSISSIILDFNAFNNNPPVWNISTAFDNPMTENSFFYLNLSQNVSDADGNPINFTFQNTSAFPSFRINISTGVINFTPIDEDVGYHNVTVYASDGVTATPREFNFTAYNVNDNPAMQTFPASPSAGVVGNHTIGVNVTEDNSTILTLWVHDDDYRIPASQRSFYRENVSVNVTIQGPNTNLFNFSLTSDFSTPTTISGSTPQRTEFDAIFTPNKSDIGRYNVTINVTDQSGASSTVIFNFTVLETQHNPSMSEVGDQSVSFLNETLYIDINSTDLEEINETASGSNLTYRIQNLTSGGDFLIINRTTGVINFTFNSTYIGVWTYNVSVNDSTGLTDSEIFSVYVYDYPNILFPTSDFQFNFAENITFALNLSANHSVGNQLNYTLIINGIVRNSSLNYGNGTAFLWNFTANFTDETTCTGVINFSLNVSNSKLSNYTSWNLTINHTNYPLSFPLSTIQNLSGGSPRTHNLTSYYYDLDAIDGCNDDTVGFSTTLINATSGSISVSVTNATSGVEPIVSYSASSDSFAEYYLTAYEYDSAGYSGNILSNYTSNNYSVEISTSEVQVPVPSSGGGGGSSNNGNKARIVSLQIIVPEPVSSKKNDKLIVPVALVNDGEIDLKKITLSTIVAKDGVLRNDLVASFDRFFFERLDTGSRENLTMTADVDTRETGIFEITITADAEDPVFSDSAKFYIEITREDDVYEKIVFTEEYLVNNPECAEIRELLDQARNLVDSGDFAGARTKTDEAIEACKEAISQPASSKIVKRLRDNVFGIVSIASLLAVAGGFVFYYFKRIKLSKDIGYQNKILEGVSSRNI